jgi:serine/threonine protein phosphatase PrpC
MGTPGDVIRTAAVKLTDVGQTRKHNEDCAAIKIPGHELLRTKGALYLVADGMGGYQAGEVASQRAAEEIIDTYYADPHTDIAASLNRAMRKANATVHETAQSDLHLVGMGTTAVVAAVRGPEVHVANVGDSRAYLLRRGKLTQITHDHSFVQDQVDAGIITPEQARTHQQRNVITRALGHKPQVEVDTFEGQLEVGDTLLLCSDGLTGPLRDEEVAAILQQHTPHEAIVHLIGRANQRGGPDNISVVLVQALPYQPGQPLAVEVQPGTAPPGPPPYPARPRPAAPAHERPASGVGRFVALGALLALLLLTLLGGGALLVLGRGDGQDATSPPPVTTVIPSLTPLPDTPSGPITATATVEATTATATDTPFSPTSTPLTSPTQTSTPQPETPRTATPIKPRSTPSSPAVPWVYETTLTIPTYGYELGFQATQPDDPVYPYPRLDFSQIGPLTPRTYRAVVLENDYVSLTILPELGGRLYRWVDKATGRQLLYQNPVVKPTQWGYRGWWLAAGGIEWAFPVEEHGLNEWRSWNYSREYTANGLSITVSNVEDRTGMEIGVSISLDADHSYVTIQPWARNDTSQAHDYQLWLNAMLTLGSNSVGGHTQFIIPAGQVTVHSSGDGELPGPGDAMNWPVHGGRDMSWYGNWSGYLGFFVPHVAAGFVGLYDHDADQGIVRAFTPGWPSGTKFFGPAGLDPTLWTDDGSNYVELWSGATGSFWAYATLNPGESVAWSERWYPVKGLGGFNYANESAALRLTASATGDEAEIGVAVSTLTTGQVTLWAGGQPVASWPVALDPGQAFRAHWTRPSDVSGEWGLRLENEDGAIVAQTGQVP